MTYENTVSAFNLIVGGAIKAVNNVVEDMVSKGDGGLLFVAGGSAMKPIPPLANIGVATSGLRNYLTNLHGALAPKGVYVGAIYVSGLIRRGTEVDPDEIADKLYNMFTARDKAEDSVVGAMPPPPPGAGAPPKP
jgi:short-subunit dehydrogenase